jgi:hypothetical protein
VHLILREGEVKVFKKIKLDDGDDGDDDDDDNDNNNNNNNNSFGVKI